MFQFYDLQAYSVVVENRNFLVRPTLDKNNNWAVKNWDVLEYRRFPYTKNNLQKCNRDILDNLETSYLNKIYLAGNVNNPLYGYCYLATQTLFYLLQTERLFPYSGVDDLGNIHSWLVDDVTGEIIDLTASQYDQLQCVREQTSLPFVGPLSRHFTVYRRSCSIFTVFRSRPQSCAATLASTGISRHPEDCPSTPTATRSLISDKPTRRSLHADRGTSGYTT